VADLSSQQYGSCKKKQCDATGAVVDVDDPTNVYEDGNPCTQESCAGGMPSTTNLASGTACTLGGGSGFCVPHPDPYNAGLVVCSECDPNGAPTCIGPTTCMGGKCVPDHCKNNAKDSGETDIDCGGIGVNSGCLKCLPGKSCTSGLDCWSSICNSNGKCEAPSCTDHVQNQDETGQDCGGGCPACADGYNCLRHSDCQSGVCKASMPGMANTCQPPTCTDGVKNGEETGVDCGDPAGMCPPCLK
jgi:hypothetical protein